MTRKFRYELSTYTFVLTVLALLSMPVSSPAQASQSTQEAKTSKSDDSVTIAPKDSNDEKSNDEKSDSATPPEATPQATPQGGLSNLARRVKTFSRNAPLRESWYTIDLGTSHVGAVIGGFEQGALLGLGIQLTTAESLRFVELRFTALTSPNLYRRFEGEAYFRHVFGEHTHADVWFDYIRRTKDNFFGIGPRIPNTTQTNFDIEDRSYNATLFHDFSRDVQAGGYVRVSNSATYRGQKDTDIPIDFLFSGSPFTIPTSRWAPGLFTNVKILSYGGYGSYDRRDNTRGLTKGVYLYGRVGSAQGLKNDSAFSDFGWLEAELDGRCYIPLGSNKTSLALRGYASLKDPRGGSQIPFYDLSYLGGRMYVRGFKNYRFRGDNAALGSAEIRQTVWTQSEERGLDVIAFGDAGQVWGDNRSRTDPAILLNQDFSSSNWRASVGGGIQYRYSKSFGARVEIGHSHERNLINFSVTRGF